MDRFKFLLATVSCAALVCDSHQQGLRELDFRRDIGEYSRHGTEGGTDLDSVLFYWNPPPPRR